jgi:hypothetical protein
MNMKRIGIVLGLLLLLLLPAGMAFGAAPYDRIIRAGETFDGDITVIDDSLLVEEDATVDGDVTMFDGSADIAGTVDGDVVVFGGRLTLTGEVDGDVALFGGDLTVGEGAQVTGDCVVFGGHVEDESDRVSCGAIGDRIDPGAWLGAITPPSVPRPPRPPVPEIAQRGPTFFSSVASVFLDVSEVIGRSLLFGLVALVIASVFPNQVRRVSNTLASKPAASGAVGVLTAVAAPSVIVLLFVVLGITIIGILLYPAVCVLALVPLAALVFGWVGVGDRFGNWLASRLSLSSRSLAVTATLGTTVLTLLLGFIGLLPFVWGEPLLISLLAVVGLGATALTKFGTAPYPRGAGDGDMPTDAAKVNDVLDTLPPKGE